MKKIYLFVLFACIATSLTYSQTITFPDLNFKSKLLEASTTNEIAKDELGNAIVIDINGNSEIEESEALTVYELDVQGSDISNLEGVNFFSNLTNLEVLDNNLVNLNASALINLTRLGANRNLLTSINVSGLINLEILVVNRNELTTLDVSDLSSLNQLSCTFNNLINLDLTNVTNLEFFFGQRNELETLELPNSTEFRVLYAYENSIADLDVTGLPNLEALRCYNNDLVDLDVSLCTNLTDLDCRDNDITSLNLNGLASLERAVCYGNNIETLFAEDCTSLLYLYASNNSIDVLNLNESPLLQTLRIGSNNMKVLLLKNGSTLDDINLFGNLDLEYVCVDEFEEDFINIQLNVYNIENAEVNTYCTFPPGGEYFTVNGNTKLDYNANGCDTDDSAFPYLKFTVSPSIYGDQFFANRNGNYVKYLGEGAFDYEPELENPSYFDVTPSTVSVSFPGSMTPFEQDFCITPNGIHPDLEIVMLSRTSAVPGFNVNYTLFYRNKGNQTLSGQVKLTFDDQITTFIDSMPNINSQNGNELYWNFENIGSYEFGEIDLSFAINTPTDTPPVNIGDILTYEATILPVDQDDTPLDNTFVLHQNVLGPTDPNDIVCLQGESVGPEIAGNYVHYRIRFENVGNFPAQNIVVKDIIDTQKFDISTLQPLQGSHEFVTRVDNDVVEFIFEDINLPFDDENNDGYLFFKIKTLPSLELEDTFSNTAAIYFDFNAPVITNTYTTVLENQLSISEVGDIENFILFPNPAGNILHLQNKKNTPITAIEVYNALGQLLIIKPNIEQIGQLDVSRLPVGNYFLKINTSEEILYTRFMKK